VAEPRLSGLQKSLAGFLGFDKSPAPLEFCALRFNKLLQGFAARLLPCGFLNMNRSRAVSLLISNASNQCKKSKDFRDIKTKSHKSFVFFRFCDRLMVSYVDSHVCALNRLTEVLYEASVIVEYACTAGHGLADNFGIRTAEGDDQDRGLQPARDS
jgi:hypothetical protein